MSTEPFIETKSRGILELDRIFSNWIRRSDLNRISFPSLTFIDTSEKRITSATVRKSLIAAGFMYPSPARIISVLMCKGGVGKTSTSYFLSQRLAMYGARVLVIDMDPQGNLTSAFHLETYGIEIDEETPVILDVITGDATAQEAIIALTPTLHLIPSTPLNAMLDSKIRDQFKNPSVPLKRVLDPLASQYDYIIVDCAPALNLTNTAVIGASHRVLLPVSPDRFSMMGLSQSLKEIQAIENDFGLSVQKNILVTKLDGREFTSKKYFEEIKNLYAEALCKNTIRSSAEIRNAVTKNEDIFAHSKSTAREDYDGLACEILGLERKEVEP